MASSRTKDAESPGGTLSADALCMRSDQQGAPTEGAARLDGAAVAAPEAVFTHKNAPGLRDVSATFTTSG